MAENSKPPLELPPFPPLRWKEPFWNGRIVLPSWKGFQCRLGPYGSQTSPNESDGTARLSVVSPEGRAERPPSAEQAKALQYLLENEEAIRDAIVNAIFEEHPAIRKKLQEGGFVEEAEMPALKRPEQLKAHLGLSTVYILHVVHQGAAYVGFELGCTWDEEHGLGVMLHQNRIVELPHMGIGKVNGADLASEDWMAEEDAQSSG
jgi:hypothetical protein